MGHAELRWLRYSLVLVWLATALVSVQELQGQSRMLLLASGVTDVRVANALVLAGAALDALLGLLLLVLPGRRVYGAALLAMLGMTLAATLLLPTLWLHPLGPLTKNVPIAVVLWILMRRSQ